MAASKSKNDVLWPTLNFQMWRWHFHRQLSGGLGTGVKRRGLHSGITSDVLPSLYSNIKSSRSWDPLKTVDHTHHRGIFNFDFSSDGKVLIGACEGGSVLMFDPLNARLVNHKNKAHSDCVNCVRFLDSRLFATCSDDTTVALWDARFLKNKVRSLSGHLSWVKNIEYDNTNSLLVTSGFDGCVYTWDINNYSEVDPTFRHVFHTSGLMRSKLTADCSKLVISLSRGYIIVIHNLDLLTLERDLHGFKPNMYRLIQMSGEMPIRIEHLDHYNRYFYRQRNRVEFITDFPVDIDAEVIASLQIHPQGWSALTRSTSSNERSEWTCVHNIQGCDWDKEPSDEVQGESANKVFRPDPSAHKQLAPGSCLGPLNVGPASNAASSSNHDSGEGSGNGSEDVWEDCSEDSSDEEDNSRGSVQIDMAIFEELFSSSPSPRHPPTAASSDHAVPSTVRIPATTDHPERLMLNREGSRDGHAHQAAEARESEERDSRAASPGQSSDARSGSDGVEYITLSLPRPPKPSRKQKRKLEPSKKKSRIIKNKPRLLCYAEEPNVGRGFIKELCFSSDGRIVCSPFGYGVRLLAFNPSCDELCDCIPESPVKMFEVATAICHSNVVVTTKYSPVHSLLVTGCLNGKASFCQPVL